jgi:hypothetical protein
MDSNITFWVLAGSAIIGILYYVLRLSLKEYITTQIQLTADTRIEAIRNDYHLNQLRTSLFFESQRTAFAEILTMIAEVNRKWFESAFEPNAGIIRPVPSKEYEKVRNIYYKHLLFLDSECIVAFELVLDALRLSIPYNDGEGGTHPRDCNAAYERLEYIQPRIADIFQEKIGLVPAGLAKQELALLGSISLLNHYHFSDIGLPVKGSLEMLPQDQPADTVAKAKDNRKEIINKMKEFQGFLSKGHGTFHQAERDIRRYLSILGPRNNGVV